jgi:hypothetical protein
MEARGPGMRSSMPGMRVAGKDYVLAGRSASESRSHTYLPESAYSIVSMITVHHLNDSRSQRILWLLEELGVPYEIRKYQRDRGHDVGAARIAANSSARQIAGRDG